MGSNPIALKILPYLPFFMRTITFVDFQSPIDLIRAGSEWRREGGYFGSVEQAQFKAGQITEGPLGILESEVVPSQVTEDDSSRSEVY